MKSYGAADVDLVIIEVCNDAAVPWLIKYIFTTAHNFLYVSNDHPCIKYQVKLITRPYGLIGAVVGNQAYEVRRSLSNMIRILILTQTGRTD